MYGVVDGTDIKLTIHDRILADAEFPDGEKAEGLQLRRLFPVSRLTSYIALMNEEGDAVCIIRNLDKLDSETRKAVCGALDEYYMIPKITKILSWKAKYGHHIWTVLTDHGQADIEITDSTNHVKRQYDDRVLIKDISDNRYEIPDLKKLDAQSYRMIMPDI